LLIVVAMSGARQRQQRAPKIRHQDRVPAVQDSLFQAAFHKSPAMQSVVHAVSGALVEVNDTFLKKLGFTRDQVIGKTPFELNFWVEPQQLAGYRQELKANGFIQGREVCLRTRDGTLLTVLLSTHPIDIGGVQHYLSAGVDISARKLAEAELRVSNEKLRQSEERFSKVFRASPALVVITRLSDGVFVAANEVFLRTTGFTQEEVIGRTSAQLNLLLPPVQREEFLRLVRKLGSVRDHEFVVRAKDGLSRTLLVSAELIDIDGEPHVQTVGLDITERKVAEEKLRRNELQLRESEARFGTAFHASPILMTIGRLRDEKFVEVNEAFMRLTGLDREEIIGRDSKELGLWVDLNERIKFYELLKRDRLLRNVESRIRSRDGTIHTMQISGEIIEINREAHLITFALDITQRKQAEQALRDSEAKFRSLYDHISSAVIVHD